MNMEQQSKKFGEFNFDSASYLVAINTYVKENDTENIENSKKTFDQLDLSIAENSEKVSQVAADIYKIQSKNDAMQREFGTLKEEEEQLTHTNLDLKEALKNVCKVTFVQNNEQFRALAQKIQLNLGFKLKLVQCQENPNVWTAKFLFDASESDINHFVAISYNTDGDTFTLCDMRPRLARFSDMAEFLTKTNDITGLLYHCWKLFSTGCSND